MFPLSSSSFDLCEKWNVDPITHGLDGRRTALISWGVHGNEDDKEDFEDGDNDELSVKISQIIPGIGCSETVG